MTHNFFQAATLKKIRVEATLKKFQVALYKNLGRFYRVLFKPLLRVQIKRAIDNWETRVILVEQACFGAFLRANPCGIEQHYSCYH